MERLRRTAPEPRLELVPLIDVLFLLITFLMFAVVLGVRAELLDVRLPAASGGRAAAPAGLVTIAIDHEGRVFLEGEALSVDDLVPRLLALRQERPDDRLLLAADERGRAGSLVEVLGRLSAAGLDEVSVVTRAGGSE
jgi:biopolymer transport protein ExbD